LDDLATIGIGADVRPLDTLGASLDKVTEKGGTTEAAVDKLVKKTKDLGAVTKGSAKDVDDISKRVEKLKSSVDPLYAAQVKLDKELAEAAKLYKAGALASGEYDKVVNSLKNRVNEAAGAHVKHGSAVNLSRMQMMELTHVARSVADSLAAGINPLKIIAFESGRVTQALSGGAGGMAGGLRAVVGLIAPLLGYAAVAAVIAGLAAIFLKGADDAAKFRNSLAATGNYAGFTADSFEAMASKVAKASDVSVGSVRKLGGELISTGKFTAETIGLIISNAEAYSKLTGQSAASIVKDYEDMKGGVVKWAVKHEEVYHDLTLAQIDQINNLEKLGKHEQAELMLQKDIHDAVKDRIADFGLLQRVLHGAMNAAGGMWDAILGVGRPKTIGDQIKDAQAKVNADAGTHFAPNTMYGMKVQADRTRLLALQSLQSMQEQGVAAAAKKSQEEDAKIRRKYDNEAAKIHQSKIDRVKEEIDKLKDEIASNINLANSFDVSTAAGFKAAAMAKASADATKLNTSANKFQALELEKAVTDELVAGSKYADQLEEKTRATEKANEIVSKTGETRAQANKSIADSVELSKLEAAQANATGKEYARLGEEINRVKKAQARANSVDNLGELIDAATARDQATAKSKNANPLEDAAKDAKFLADVMDKTNERIQNSAAGMASAFGSIGAAMGQLVVAVSNYDKVSSDIEAKRAAALVDEYDQAKIKKINAEAAKEQGQAEADAFGNALAAAKGFFKEKSAGYKALQAVEGAYRLFEFAMSAKSVVVSAIEMGRKIAHSAATAAAYASEAIANALRSLPFPLNLAAAAATAAALVGAGVALFGGGHGGSGSAANAATTQAAQGAGSVFGDPTAKSGSIDKSLTAALAYQNKDLEYSLSMVKSLKSIESGIGALAASVVRSLQASGALSTSGLNLGTSTKGPGILSRLAFPIANLLPGLFGSKTTNTLNDQGLSFGQQSLSDLINNGVNGHTFADLSSKTSNKLFGVTVHTSTKNSTVSGALDDDLARQITGIIGSLRGTVLDAAKALGLDGAQAVLDAFQVNLGKISFKDMTGAQITDALNAVFSKLGDDFAKAVGGDLVTKFQKVGEGALETLVRVARGIQVFDVQMKVIGKTFAGVGGAGIDARQTLIDLVGGIDEFVQQTNDYVDGFLTDAEKIAPVQKAVNDQLKALGVNSVKSKDDFKSLVSSLDLTTDAGQALFASLMAIAPAFAKVADFFDADNANKIKAAQDGVAKAQTDLTNVYNAQADVLKTLVSKFQQFSSALKAFRQTLETGQLAGLSPEEQYRKTRDVFEQTKVKAASGDETALGNLQSVSQDFLSASRDYNASSVQYFRDLDEVKAGVDAAAASADTQANIAQQQLDQLTGVVGQLIQLNTTAMSIETAIANLKVANDNLTTAQQTQANPFTVGGTGTPTPANDVFNAASYLTSNPDVAGAYSEYAANQATWATSGFGMNDTPEQFASDHYRIAGKAEGRMPFAHGGIIDRPMTIGEAGIGGEAGTEGIVPLTRTPSGKLGVSSLQDGDVKGALLAILKELKGGNRQRGAGNMALLEALTMLSERVDRLERTTDRKRAA
jgi:phage-related minor tail protein